MQAIKNTVEAKDERITKSNKLTYFHKQKREHAYT